MNELTREEALRRWNATKATKRAMVEKMQKVLYEDHLARTGEAQSGSASEFYGVWKDSDFDMSSDELTNEIKASRTSKDDIEAF